MPTPWEASLDPSDNVDFYADFGAVGESGTEAVLAEGEAIDSFTAIPTAAATAAGLLVGASGQYAPSKVNDDRTVKMWLSIDPDKRDNCEFGTTAGLALGVEVSIVTDSVPPRSFQRTWTVTVRNL